MPQEARPRELEQADAGPTTPTRPVTASRSTAMSATLDIEEHDLDLSDALQQVLARHAAAVASPFCGQPCLF